LADPQVKQGLVIENNDYQMQQGKIFVGEIKGKNFMCEILNKRCFLSENCSKAKWTWKALPRIHFENSRNLP